MGEPKYIYLEDDDVFYEFIEGHVDMDKGLEILANVHASYRESEFRVHHVFGKWTNSPTDKFTRLLEIHNKPGSKRFPMTLMEYV